MSESKWTYEQDGNSFYVTNDHGTVAKAGTEDKARLIVKAVNAHDELTELLGKATTALVAYAKRAGVDEETIEASSVIQRARALLAKLENNL